MESKLIAAVKVLENPTRGASSKAVLRYLRLNSRKEDLINQTMVKNALQNAVQKGKLYLTKKGNYKVVLTAIKATEESDSAGTRMRKRSQRSKSSSSRGRSSKRRSMSRSKSHGRSRSRQHNTTLDQIIKQENSPRASK